MSSSTPAPHPADAHFQSALSACSTGLGGDLKFVDAFFSFLRRRTPLLQSQNGVEQVQGLALKHVDLARKNKASKEAEDKKKKEEAAEEKRKAEEAKKKEQEAAAAAAAAAASSSSSSSSSTPVTELKDAPEGEDEEDKLPTPINNGGVTEHYSWSQSLAEVNVSIPLPAGTTAKMLSVTIEPTELHAELKGASGVVYVSGEPDERIDSDNATWTLETNKDGSRTLDLFLPKVNKMTWWSRLVKGGPPINTKKIVPENSKLEDLDGEMRTTVEKMMFDQRAKMMGQPTSEESNRQKILEKFMAAHPEMDFSNAKISGL